MKFLNGKLDQIFNTNDFVLVDITHEVKCWKESYEKLNNTINDVSIIKEYEFNSVLIFMYKKGQKL